MKTFRVTRRRLATAAEAVAATSELAAYQGRVTWVSVFSYYVPAAGAEKLYAVQADVRADAPPSGWEVGRT